MIVLRAAVRDLGEFRKESLPPGARFEIRVPLQQWRTVGIFVHAGKKTSQKEKPSRGDLSSRDVRKPRRAAVIFRQTTLSVFRGRPDSAEGTWRQLASMTATTATTAMPRHRRKAILREASGYIELGELLVQQDTPVPPSGQRLLQRAIDLLASLEEPTRSSAIAKLLEGEALRALGRFEEGLVALELVAKEEPKRLEAWLGMGWCLKRLGRLDDAILALERGLAASPRQPILLYNLACYHSLAGRVQAAIEHLTKAISLDGRFRDLTGAEPDFDPIRQDPRFVAATHITV
jgi:predicted Zn-dependent protease